MGSPMESRVSAGFVDANSLASTRRTTRALRALAQTSEASAGRQAPKSKTPAIRSGVLLYGIANALTQVRSNPKTLKQRRIFDDATDCYRVIKREVDEL